MKITRFLRSFIDHTDSDEMICRVLWVDILCQCIDLASPDYKIAAVTPSFKPTRDPGDHFEVPVNIPVKR